ncbi:MAG: DegV family protein [Eubacteriales bacterium]|nr:DegV family protein [Eubacteriales bacterium]
MAIRIFADSTCDLEKAQLERFGVTIVPLYVTLGDNHYRDGVDISPEDIFRHFEKTKETPKTAAPTPGDFIESFKPAAQNGDDILFIGISSHMSACCNNAILAAKEFPDTKIEVVDSQNLSTGIGLLVMKAGEFVVSGMTLEMTAQKLRTLVPKVRASFVIDTLTYLYHGGRCNALQAFGANALHLKPKIVVCDGKMGTSSKYRGKIQHCAQRYAKDIMKALEGVDTSRVFVTYSVSDDVFHREVGKIVEASGVFNEVVYTRAGCVISSHCGPYTIGVLYIEE